MTYLNKPILSLAFSILALIAGAAVIAGNSFLSEQQSAPMFLVLFPATIVLAILGFLFGTTSPTPMVKASVIGYLLGGAILAAIVVWLVLPAFTG